MSNDATQRRSALRRWDTHLNSAREFFRLLRHLPLLAALALTACGATKSAHLASPTVSPTATTTPIPTLSVAGAIDPYATLFSIAMVSTGEGWAVGRTLNAAGERVSLIVHYSNAQWTKVTSPVIANATLMKVRMVSASDGWAVGSTTDVSPVTGILLHYSSGSWTQVPAPANVLFSSLASAAPQDEWAAGAVLDPANPRASGRTEFAHWSGGRWTPSTTVDGSVTDLTMVSQQEGWAVGSGATGALLLHYTGGEWTRAPTPFDTSAGAALWSISMVSPSEGWAVGFGASLEPLLLHYEQGTWGQVSASLPHVQPFAVQMLTASQGWAAGRTDGAQDEGILVQYSEGIWKEVISPRSGEVRELAMVSPDDGWAVGSLPDGALLLHYTRGTWRGYSG